MPILGISGSLRRDSYNTNLLRAAAELLPPGVELEIYDGLKAVPPYDEDDDLSPAPPAVVDLRGAIAEADAVLFATPEYNGSVPGQLKNAVDWASRPAGRSVLRHKPVAVVGASTGMFGAVWAQAELRKILQTVGARVVDRELPVMHAHDRLAAGGELREGELRQALAEHVAALVEAARERELAAAADDDRSPAEGSGGRSWHDDCRPCARRPRLAVRAARSDQWVRLPCPGPTEQLIRAMPGA